MAYLTPFFPKILAICGKNHFSLPKSLFFRGWVGGFTSLGQLTRIKLFFLFFLGGGFPYWCDVNINRDNLKQIDFQTNSNRQTSIYTLRNKNERKINKNAKLNMFFGIIYIFPHLHSANLNYFCIFLSKKVFFTRNISFVTKPSVFNMMTWSLPSHQLIGRSALSKET